MENMSSDFVNALNKLHFEVNGTIDKIEYIAKTLRKWQKVYEEKERQRKRDEWIASLDEETRKLATHCAECTKNMYSEHLKEAEKDYGSYVTR